MNAITFLSLIVAALAVFVGPLISLLITRRQIESAQRVATQHVLAPMRQAWINELRKLLAELLATSRHYYGVGYDNRSEAEYRRMDELEFEIRLMLNPTEMEHQQLMKSMRELLYGLSTARGREGDEQFIAAHDRTNALAHAILKMEWNRTKSGD